MTLVLEDLCWELIAATSGSRVWGVKVGMGVPLWLCQARDLLNDRLTGALPITSIAQELGIHPVYFARGFRKYYGCNPSEYRMRCRLQRAMTSLCRSNHSLSSIALDAGFFDQGHFTTAFKQPFGHAPGIYRKNLVNATMNRKRFRFCKTLAVTAGKLYVETSRHELSLRGVVCSAKAALFLVLSFWSVLLHAQAAALMSIEGLWSAETRLGIPVEGELA